MAHAEWQIRHRRTFRSGGIAAAACALGLAGCQTNGGGKPGEPARLVPRPVPYIADVPLPANFRLVERNTEDYISGNFRNVRHEYEGTADRAALRAFYQEQMPTFRWARLTDQNVKGEITMRFEKGNEACSVLIRPKGTGWFNQTLIQVIIQPFERGGGMPPARPRTQ